MYRDQIKTIESQANSRHDKHFKKGMYLDLISFLHSESIGFEEVFIMDPYFCIRSLEVVKDWINYYFDSNNAPHFKILKCKGQNVDNGDKSIKMAIDNDKCLKTKNIQIFDTLGEIFHSRYLIFRKNDPEKGDVGVKIFVISDSYYKIKESELDMVNQTDYESAYTTISRYERDHCKLDTNKQIYPGRQNAK
jgi:hypothetical protein